MKPGYLTTEFYITIIATAIVGFAVNHGFIESSQSNTLIQSFVTVYGGLVTIAPSVFYIIGRMWLKSQYNQYEQPTDTTQSVQKSIKVNLPSSADTSSNTQIEPKVQNANPIPSSLL